MLFCAWILGLVLRSTAALAMTFSPTVVDLAVVPGETATADFTVQNTSDDAKSYIVSMYDVTLSSSFESPHFAPIPQRSSEWLTLDTYSFTLESGASRVLLLQASPPLAVMNDAFVIGLVVREIAEDNGIAVASGVTSLVFVTVGDPTTNATVQSWDVSPRFTARLNLDVTATIANDGERVVQPYGSVVVSNTFGRVVDVVNINPTLGRIPSSDVRTFTANVHTSEEGGFFYELWREVIEHRLGIFTAKLVAAPYPGGDATLTATAHVVVFPWRLALVLGVIGGSIVVIRRRR